MTEGRARICYLADADSVHTRKWCRHFAGLGFDVHVLSLRAPSEPISNVTVHDLAKARSAYRQAIRIWRYALVYPSARSLVRELRPAILHAHYASGYGLLGSLMGFHPFVISVWGSDVLTFPAVSPLHRALVKFNLARADYVCSTSRFMARETGKYTEKEPVLTPFGVDCEMFKPLLRPAMRDEVAIGTVRPLEEGYGITNLIEAFSMIHKREKFPGLKLIIVGDGPERSLLERLASSLNVGHQTEFVGWVPHERVPEYLHRFSIFVAPSIHPEGFGVAVLEASACGIPTVAFDVGGLPEVVEHGVTGMIVPPGNTAALADTIQRLVESGELREKLGRAGRKFALDRYEWSTTAKSMESLYESILGRQGAKVGDFPAGRI